jgi:CHAD domain-containing protein
MDKQHIRRITDAYYRKLKKHLDEVAAGFNAAAIHQFRVTYKKLRAFFRMLSLENRQQDEITILKKFKQVYNLAGAIRDLQLQRLRVHRAAASLHAKAQGYFIVLSKEMNRYKIELLQALDENPLAESKKKTNAALPGQCRAQRFQSFIKKKQNNIQHLLSSTHLSDDAVHEIRKNIKDLFYNSEIQQKAGHPAARQGIWKGKDEQCLHQLLEALGHFQDQCTAVALLKPAWLNKVHTVSGGLLQQIKEQWLAEKAVAKKQLIKKLKTGLVTAAVI